MNGLERILTTLKRQEPDRVPHFEAGIDGVVMEEILPGGSEEDFIEHMDLDAACVHYRWFTKYEMIDESKRKVAGTGWASELDRPIYFLENREGYLCGWCSLEK